MHLVNAAYAPPKLRRQVPVDPQILTTYAGRYELTPNFALTVRADGGRLFVQATKQQEYRSVRRERDAISSIAWSTPRSPLIPPKMAQTRTLTLHQNGRDRPGRRVP